MMRICDLPPELVGMIFTKIPITSLRAIRSTCKLWNSLSKEWVLGEASAARQQFLGFMTMDLKVLSLRFDFQGILKDEDELVDPSIKQVDIFSQVEITKVFHCNGLLLCIVKDKSRLVVWNPYLGQTRWIKPRKKFRRQDRYALGYNNVGNHKILRFLDYNYGKHLPKFEIYDLSSKSWRVLKVTPDWYIEFYHRGVSVKGNTYFFAIEKAKLGGQRKDFIMCFDFTREEFGPRLALPYRFWSLLYNVETLTLSCVREEQLAVLYQIYYDDTMEFWVTTTIDPNALSWSKFLKVDISQRMFPNALFMDEIGSFLINEEEKVAVVFFINHFIDTKCTGYPKAFVGGEDGYFKTLSIRDGEPYKTRLYSPLVCSSFYLPSLVQIKQRSHKRKDRDD